MLVLDAEGIRNAKISLILIFSNIFSFITFNLLLPIDILLLLSQINFQIINHLEVWRLITPIFLHADVLHLFSNCIALLFFGAMIENYYKRWEFAAIYFCSGVIGNVFSLFFLPLESISLGASGAIFGLIGAAFILFALKEPSLLLLSGIYVIYFIVSSFSPGINIWAHLFGLAGGISLGYVFKKVRDRDERY